jgi:hypothetical protein
MGVQTAQDREQIVQSAVKGISHIATLPEITLKIIELVEDPKSTAHDLHSLIANDPALMTKMLPTLERVAGGRLHESRRVTTGIRTAENIQILEGLAPYDTVLTSGLQRMRPGLPVRLAETTEGAIPEEPEDVSPEVDVMEEEDAL